MRRSFVLAVLITLFFFRNSATAQYTTWDYPEQPRTHNTDVQNIEMHISFDQPAKKVIGTVYHTLSILPQRDATHDVVFDAANLHIERVWIEEGKGKTTPVSFDTSESNKLRMSIPVSIGFNTPFRLGIQYWGKPKRGMYFIEPDTFYTTKPSQIWTQGEGEDNRHWLPTYDYPNDKTTTEMFVTVRGDQQALSNGHLVDKDKNKDGTVTWHYKEDRPYSTYLIMLGIGNYEVPTDKWRGKNVEYWVYPGWSKEAKRIFGLTPKMLEFFSSKIGFEYGWEKYAQIAIADFMYGGMENVSATTLNDYVLYDQRAGIDFSGEGLIAHELAHQWFGDVLTCRSWINMWLNESFATYFEALFREYHDGKDEFDEELQGNMLAALGTEINQGRRPIIAPNAFSTNTYQRGSTVLNMMRHVLGDEGWWNSMNHYVTKHQYQNVIAEDLRTAIQEATGQNLQWFFDEWLFKSGHPVFDVNYNYDASAHLLRMTVTQTQQRDSMTGTFKMPIDVELTMPDGSTRLETLRVQDSTQNFTIVSPEAPVMVIFDKGNTTVKEMIHHKTTEEWIYQLQHAKLAIERSLAAQHLGATTSSPAVMSVLTNAALHDPFWSTRQYATTALGQLADSAHSIMDVLTTVAQRDPKSDVRATAMDMLARYAPKDVALPIATRALSADSSYRVMGAALRVINHFDQAEASTRALKYLETSSPRDRMRQYALDILQLDKNRQNLDALVSVMGQRNVPKWTRWNVVGGIAGMVNVDSARVYDVLWNLTQNGDNTVSGTALNKLADIGNAETLRRLEQRAQTAPADMKGTYDALLERMRKRLSIPEGKK